MKLDIILNILKSIGIGALFPLVVIIVFLVVFGFVWCLFNLSGYITVPICVVIGLSFLWLLGELMREGS